MEVNLAGVPSNQDYSVEQSIQKPTGDEIVAEVKRQGYNAKSFFRPGSYDGVSDNIPELHWMLNEAVKWLKQFPAATRYSVSNHSNAGITTTVYIQPQLTMQADWDWGIAAGKDLAARVGGVFQKVRVRSLMYMEHMYFLGKHRSILHETGNHQGSVQAAYLLRYARFNGIQIARCFLTSIGAPLNAGDGPVPSDVIVPPGAQFDKYRPGTVTPPVPPPPPLGLPVLKMCTPLMRDVKTGDFALTYKVNEFPIHWLQDGLASHTYKLGYTYTVDGETRDIRSLKADGICGSGLSGPSTTSPPSTTGPTARRWWPTPKSRRTTGTR